MARVGRIENPVTMSCVVTADMKAKIETLALEEERTPSEIIRKLLKNGLKES